MRKKGPRKDLSRGGTMRTSGEFKDTSVARWRKTFPDKGSSIIWLVDQAARNSWNIKCRSGREAPQEEDLVLAGFSHYTEELSLQSVGLWASKGLHLGKEREHFRKLP